MGEGNRMKQVYYICEFCDKFKINKKHVQSINVCPKCGKNTLMTLVIDDEPEKVKK